MENGFESSELITESLQKVGRTFKVTKRSLIIDCPNCYKEEKCYVLKKDGRAICWSCSKTWNMRGILADILGISKAEATTKMIGMEFHKDGSARLNLNLHDKLADSSQELSDADFEEIGHEESFKSYYFDPSFIPLWESERAINYVISRGCTDPAVWVRHNLMYHAGMDGIVAPIYMYGTPVGFQTRFIDPKNPNFRMKTSDALPRDRVVYNLDNASKKRNLIVVEGIFDCLKSDTLQDFGSIATMGKTLNEGQINLIRNGPWEKVYIGLDRDAVEEVQQLAMQILEKKKTYRILPPDERKDFGECSPDEVQCAIELALECSTDPSARLEIYLK